MGSDEQWQETSQHCRIVIITDHESVPHIYNNCNFIKITSCQETYSVIIQCYTVLTITIHNGPTNVSHSRYYTRTTTIL